MTGILAARGPLTTSALVGALNAEPTLRGLDPGAVLDEVVDADVAPTVRQLIDGRWCDTSALLAGRVVTHRLTQDEALHGFAGLVPDLAALLPLEDALDTVEPLVVVYPDLDHVELAERGIPGELIPATGAILLPDGFVAANGLRADDLISLRFDEAGAVLGSAGRSVAFPPGVVQALARLLDRHQDHDFEIEEAVLNLCAIEP